MQNSAIGVLIDRFGTDVTILKRMKLIRAFL